MLRLWRENITHYKGWLMLSVGCMAIVAGCTAFMANMMEPIIDDIFVNRNRDMLWTIGGLVLATFVVKGFANYGQTVLMSFVGHKIITDNQKRLYNHLSGMDLSFFHNNSTGRLISRFTVDIGLMRSAVSNVITGFGKDFLTLIGLVAVMFHKDFLLASTAFFVFPVAILPIVKIGRKMRKVSVNTQEEMGLFTTLLEQTFQGIRVVKAYGMANYEKGRLGGIIDRLLKLNMRAERTRAASSPIMETLGGVAIFIVIIYGGNRVMNGETTSGAFFAFITALLLAYEPMKRLANLNASLQQGMAGAQRMFDVLDTPPSITDKADAKPIGEVRGEIQLDNVSFSYDTNGQKALNDISLTVPAGATVALVGPSGAGKSTILNLIPRFYDIDAGRVLVDGHDVRDVTMASLYSNIALVSQEIVLFDDTIRANIAYGRAGASEQDIQDAARNAAAHDFIEQQSGGYDTVVGEQGVKLSGGQRQRLAIARAMLKNAPVLLLDEATSALDTESERQVQAALEKLMQGRTTLVIAHRLSTVVDADLICVIDNGRVIEQGTHQQLIEADGAYKALYSLQFAEEESDASTDSAQATLAQA